jgi:hypothetical protein
MQQTVPQLCIHPPSKHTMLWTADLPFVHTLGLISSCFCGILLICSHYADKPGRKKIQPSQHFSRCETAGQLPCHPHSNQGPPSNFHQTSWHANCRPSKECVATKLCCAPQRDVNTRCLQGYPLVVHIDGFDGKTYAASSPAPALRR